jgi:Mg2+/citrate symporter
VGEAELNLERQGSSLGCYNEGKGGIMMLDWKQNEIKRGMIPGLVIIVLVISLFSGIVTALQRNKVKKIERMEEYSLARKKITLLEGQKKPMRQQNQLPIWTIPVNGKMLLM